jgi:hypothetical protein
LTGYGDTMKSSGTSAFPLLLLAGLAACGVTSVDWPGPAVRALSGTWVFSSGTRRTRCDNGFTVDVSLEEIRLEFHRGKILSLTDTVAPQHSDHALVWQLNGGDWELDVAGPVAHLRQGLVAAVTTSDGFTPGRATTSGHGSFSLLVDGDTLVLHEARFDVEVPGPPATQTNCTDVLAGTLHRARSWTQLTTSSAQVRSGR